MNNQQSNIRMITAIDNDGIERRLSKKDWAEPLKETRYQKYRKTKKSVSTSTYHQQLASSKKRGHAPPDYNLKEFRMWLYSQPNFNELYDNWVLSNYDKWSKPSPDRLDDDKPYTLDNLQIMTWLENKLKGEADRRNGINNKLSKSVVQMNKNGEFICEYHSIANASRETGINRSHISECCRGMFKLIGGFKWKYAG